MPQKKRPNIVFISFDDCRADHLGFMGYQKKTSPFLDSLAKQSVRFTKAFATGSGSPQSFVGALTSTYPLDYGGFSFIDKPRVLISEIFQRAGYQTIAVHSAPYMSGYFGYDQGWDNFHYLSHFNSGEAGIHKETFQAKILKKISSTKRWLKKHAAFITPLFTVIEKSLLLVRKIAKDATNYTPPFLMGNEINKEIKKILPSNPNNPLFLWVHYMDIHEPLGFFWRANHGLIRKLKFHLADILLFLFGPYSRVNRLFKNLFMELYDASLQSVDGHIGELFSYLQEKNILSADDALFIWSDHGEEFFEKGVFGHEQRPFNVNLNIPLIIWHPQSLQPKTDEEPVSLIDISPTALDLAGIVKPAAYKGLSLFDETQRAVVAEQVDCEGDLTNLKFLGAAIIDQGYKYIDFRGERFLFALGDKEEKNNLCEEKKEIVEALGKKLGEYIPKSFKYNG